MRENRVKPESGGRQKFAAPRTLRMAKGFPRGFAARQTSFARFYREAEQTPPAARKRPYAERSGEIAVEGVDDLLVGDVGDGRERDGGILPGRTGFGSVCRAEKVCQHAQSLCSACREQFGEFM